ncbi:hypothetical protein CVD28_15150 [Bacillus sp. M6-12]|uniref:anti-sigma factor domain-containing protein n=1 Tax=Bacillus sp. M6-12 TaxID=2054166 RepID=UPI000C7607B3|nr:anti-sigma factor domain-containing protein [Bacillus sp. M6-12]PLS16430.1 hypothetical protein CVD28_15150 [Bacillus sp. M6-12]
MKKGVVLDVDNRFVTLMTPEGEFIKMKRKKRDSYEIGKEVQLVTSSEAYRGIFLGLNSKKVLTAGAAAAMLFGLTYLPFLNNNSVSAYMTIDVNPSIEIGLNKGLEVIELNGLNKEGKQILEKLDDWKQQNVHEIASKIILETKSRGYLKKEKEIVFSTVLLDRDNKELSGELQQEMKLLASASKKDAEVTVLEGSAADRKKAKKEGLSTGRYIDKIENKDKPESGKMSKEKNKPKKNSETGQPKKNQPDNKKIIPAEPKPIKKEAAIKPVAPNTFEKNKKTGHDDRNNHPKTVKKPAANLGETIPPTLKPYKAPVKPNRPAHPSKPTKETKNNNGNSVKRDTLNQVNGSKEKEDKKSGDKGNDWKDKVSGQKRSNIKNNPSNKQHNDNKDKDKD